MKTTLRIENRRRAHQAALSSLVNGKIDGLTLWRRLGRLERALYQICLNYTNGTNGIDSKAWEQAKDSARLKLTEIFGGTIPKGVFINGDPRGHMLKLDCGDSDSPGVPIPDGMEKDWGGNGILAAEIDGEA